MEGREIKKGCQPGALELDFRRSSWCGAKNRFENSKGFLGGNGMIGDDPA